MKVHHINCVKIKSPFGPAIGHCLLLVENDKLVLVDSGIGVDETRKPDELLGQELVDRTGYVLDENITAFNQIKQLGFDPNNVEDIICSHLDPDHIGGLIDFPKAKVHISQEEFESFKSGIDRYLPRQLSHDPKVELYKNNDSNVFGLPARKLKLAFKTNFYFIPLFGHTSGHSAIAFKTEGRWILYVGDAYYYRAELTNKEHPVDQLATIAAVDNEMRKESLEKLRELIKNFGDELYYFGYHDPKELDSKVFLN